MRRPDLLSHRVRAVSLAAVLLGIVFAAIACGFEIPRSSPPQTSAASADGDMTREPMRDMPGLQCCATPVQEVSTPPDGKGKALAPAHWRSGAALSALSVSSFDAGGRRAHMPVRIALCRWLN